MRRRRLLLLFHVRNTINHTYDPNVSEVPTVTTLTKMKWFLNC